MKFLSEIQDGLHVKAGAIVVLVLTAIVSVVTYMVHNNYSLRNLDAHPLKYPHVSTSQSRFQEDKSRLEQFCSFAPKDQIALPFWAWYLVDQKHKFVFFMNPKTGTMSWRGIFAILSKQRNNVSEKDAGSIWTKMTAFVRANDTVRKAIIASHFKFVFVRDPFDRLQSAYRNKILSAKSTMDIPVRRYIQRTVPKNKTKPSLQPVSISDFVSYILNEVRLGRTLDQHWRPQYLTIAPCTFPYDFIGHYESIAEDSAFVLRKFFPPLTIDMFPKLNASPASLKSRQKILQFCEELTSAQIAGLKRLYAPDYMLFGYNSSKSC